MSRGAPVRPAAAQHLHLSRMRLLVVYAFILFIASMTLFKLLEVQVVRHAHYRERADLQYLNRHVLEPDRGSIEDRRGRELVTNLPNHWSVGVRPSLVEDKPLLARRLADVLELPVGQVRSRLASRGSFVWIQRKVDGRRAAKVRALGRSEITLQRETLRRYPYGRTAGQVLGHVTVDNTGNGGVELVYDGVLSGTSGWEVVQKDAHMREMVHPAFPREAPVDGGRIVLSIDVNAQSIAEEELEREVERTGADGGMIVVTRPSTGEVLAVASCPRYDPNEPGEYPVQARKNKAVTDVFEPGSTFKVVTFAGVLERDLVDIDDPVWCENGSWEVYDRVIRDSHRFGWLSVRNVLAKSSNIGTAKLAERMPVRDFYTVMRDFGFGQETGVQLPGEVRGIVPSPGEWSGVSMANMAMGHGVAVTAVQLAMAYGAIANDGFLMKPILVLSVTDQKGRVQLAQPTLVRRVMTPTTSRTLRHLLTDAVELGTGQNATIEGLQVAGKTGTAQKVNYEKGTYYQDRYVSSFAGFLPAERPELLAVVVIDDPKHEHYGGAVAAPVFRRVMKRLLVTLPRREPLLPGDDGLEARPLRDDRAVVPALVGLGPEAAEEELARAGLELIVAGRGRVVGSQSLPPGSVLERGRPVEVVLASGRVEKEEAVRVPDMRGLSLRKAVAELSRRGFDVRVDGSGVVVSQSLPPGRKARAGSVCSLLARPPLVEAR